MCRASPRRERPPDALPDDQRRRPRARHRRVEHLAAQEVRTGGGMRDHDRDRQLDPLPLVDAARVRELQPRRLLVGQLDDQPVGADGELLVRVVASAAARCRSSAPARAGCGRRASACRRSAAGRRAPGCRASSARAATACSARRSRARPCRPARTPGCRSAGRRRSARGAAWSPATRSRRAPRAGRRARSGTGRAGRPRLTSNDGGRPWRTSCAPRTIMLPAAWRKMWVSSATGNGRVSTSSANGLPAPTGAS